MKGPLNLVKKANRKLKVALGLEKSPDQLFKEGKYLDAYSKQTDYRVEADPKGAPGPSEWWNELGKHQFDFLVKMGLQPQHKMLDIGCGTLRGGRYFIDYLNQGNYFGIDISQGAIDYAKNFVKEKGLNNKNPTLLVNENKDLKFKEVEGNKFDFIFAQSVFTHLPKENVEECIQYVGNVMNKGAVFYFTYENKGEYKQTGTIAFSYPFSFFEELARNYGFEIADVTEEYNHPRGRQDMIRFTKK